MARIIIHTAFVAILTLLTQIGGLAWLIGLAFKWRLSVFAAAYLLLSISAVFLAPLFGRVPLVCASDGPLMVQSWSYCVLNRNYVTPELRSTLEDLAGAVDRAYPGTETLVLDAGFPFWNGFPLFPHLSHNDGEKADIAFYYQDRKGKYLPGRTRSPIGYFAFEPGPTECPDNIMSLRWDLNWLQPVWLNWPIEPERTRAALIWLTKDPRIGKVFIEPHLKVRLGLSDPKLRFQGCRAARHDDHIHIQL